MKSKNIQAPVALITGAGRRIGREIAMALHAADYRVVIHYFHSKAEAEQLAAALNEKRANSAMLCGGDLRDTQFLKDLIEETTIWGARLDTLINNASIFKKDNQGMEIPSLHQELFSINVETPFILSQFAFPYLKQTQGTIINITDIHAHKPLKDYSIYSQTKAALVMQTKSLALEFAPNARVNAVAPGAILWPENVNELSLKVQEKIIRETPLKQHGHPKYIAQAILALLNNSFITGQVLAVDGGRSLCF